MRAIETPASHRNDPITSRLAEVSITASGERRRLQALTVSAVCVWPGLTSMELSLLAPGIDKKLDRATLARRLGECVTAGKVKRGPVRKCKVNLSKAITWYPFNAEIQQDLFNDAE